MKLKYGCNPNQGPAEISLEGRVLPLRVLNGTPGYINMLDALNGWQLVRELKEALGLAAAASFKHTSPAGAAVGLPLTDELRTAYFAGDEELSPLACAYIRARGADRLSSFGDFAALSDRCDEITARALKHEVSDGVIAPGYDAQALAILKEKRGGSYIVLEMDEGYSPPEMEARQVFGLTLMQRRNDVRLNPHMLGDIVTANKALPEAAARDLALALITLKYTQSNSVCFAQGGQATGIGAGQQSRVHCVRLAGQKADTWWLRQHPDVLKLPFPKDMPRPARDNAVDEAVRGDVALSPEKKRAWLNMPRPVALASDGFFPFSDNIDAAAACGARYIAQPGGSVRDKEVIAACDKHGMVMVHTGIRLFYH